MAPAGLASRRCHTGVTLGRIPTKHPRHAITETPPVRAALDELRDELGDSRIEFSELLILGAQEKLARLRAEREGVAVRRARLADRIRGRDLPLDPAAADEVRRHGWARS
ncbi:MAG TPA: hypothetical protein VI300_03465 [Solirubrobacter sp.]